MNGYKSMEDESTNYFRMISFFTHEAEAEIGWDRKEQEIDMIQKECTFDKIREFYKLLFAPGTTAIRRGRTYDERRASMTEAMGYYREFYNTQLNKSKSVAGARELVPLVDFEKMLSE